MLIKDLRNLHAEKLQASKALAEKDVLTEQEQAELDVLLGELEQVGSKIKSLERVLEQEVLQAQSQSKASQVIAANNSFVEVKSNEPAGTTMANMVRSLIVSGGNREKAVAFAETTLMDPRAAKALGTGSTGAGAVLVPSDIANEIAPALRANSVVRQAGARVIPNPSGVLTLPAVSAGSSASYTAENSNITSTQPTFAGVAFAKKKLTAICPISNELVQTASNDVVSFIIEELTSGMGATEDLNFLRGATGGANPVGISNRVAAGQKVAMTATPDYAKVEADLQGAIARVVASGVKLVKPAWVLSTRTWNYLSSLYNGVGTKAYPEMANGMLKGYPFFISQQIPENLSTNQTELYFGAFNEAIIAETSGLIISVSQEASYYDGSNTVSAFGLDQTVVKAVTMHDFNIRYDKAFSMITGLTWGV